MHTKTRSNLFTLFTLLVCLREFSLAQIPNAGFENWTGDTVTGWWVNNVAPLYSTISKTSTAHGGSYAVRGDVAAFYTQVVQPVIQSGTDARGFPYSQRPASFTGYYQFSPATSSGDRFGVNVVLYKGGVDGTPVGVAALALSSTVTSYTQFIAPFNYITSDNPDTCVIQFQIVGSTAQQSAPTLGSYFLLDDIAFSGVSGVAERRTPLPTTFQLNQNYPNPFNPTTVIRYTLPENVSRNHVTLKVYNLLGQEIKTLVDYEQQAGYYETSFNAKNLSSGVYIYRLTVAGDGSRKFVDQKKMLLIK